jgi:HSP20 family molecular chaperone IbpA
MYVLFKFLAYRTRFENVLTISFDTENMKYFKEAEVPVAANSENRKAKYTNGVPEVTLIKIKAEKPTGEQIEWPMVETRESKQRLRLH